MRAALLACLLLLPTPALAKQAWVDLWMGYGTPTAFVLSGRVLADKGIRPPARHRTGSDNVIDVMKALLSDELPGVRVELSVGERRYEVVTDEEGVFELRVEGLAVPLAAGEHPVRARLRAGGKHQAAVATGTLRVLPDEELVCVLSDVDDTVLESYVHNKLRLATNALFRNAAQLEPVAGAPEAYRRAMDAGAAGVFYLSGSPINFYQRIQEFLRQNEFPSGPLLLKNFGSDDMFKQESYKRRRLEALLAALPKARFILVGDSTEHDPEIYRHLRDDFPERVAGVVIRRPPPDKSSPAARFEGAVVIADFTKEPDLLAGLVRAALSEAPSMSLEREGPLEVEVDAQVE